MKKLFSLLTALCLAVCLCGSLTDIAFAGDLDYIRRYDVTVTPNTEDGSLRIQADFQWEVLDEGPVTWLQIGIPNGSIRDVEAMTGNIAQLDFDNSFMYVYFDRGYDDGEVFDFSYAWTQEYMYTLGSDGSVSYDYTPGWFDEARIGEMTVTWNTPEGVVLNATGYFGTDGDWTERAEGNSCVYTGTDLPHGEQLQLNFSYATWPTELFWEGSSENLTEDDRYYEDDWYYDDYYEDDPYDAFAFIFVLILITAVVLIIIVSSDGYSGGFGATTHYVQWHGLWYPAGRDGRPRPNSVGTKHKPSPPRSSGTRRSGGGFGGGSRGGGFGGGGFGGGGHCACASSCACACACACAGGGRAGCSAKNLYGAVQLDRTLTEHLTEE